MSAHGKTRICLLLAVLGALSLAPWTASAGELDGLWGAQGSRYYGFAITEDYGGRVSIRDSRGTVARGFRNGYRIELRSTDGNSTPWTGMIASVQRGSPVEIQMSSGTVLRRVGSLPPVRSVDPPAFAGGTAPPTLPQPFPEPPPSEPPPEPSPQPLPPSPFDSAAQVAGVYVSNPLGLTYRITQTGNSFRWTIDGLAQQGQGTIDGGRVHASWQGPLVRGSSGGTIVSGAGGVTALRFDNGMTLTWQQP